MSSDENEESNLQENVEEIFVVLQPDTQQLKSLGMFRYKGIHFPPWMCSPTLKGLVIGSCREIGGLHEALQHMTALHSLQLYNLSNLEYL